MLGHTCGISVLTAGTNASCEIPKKKLVWLLCGAPFVASGFVFVSLPLQLNISLPDLEQK